MSRFHDLLSKAREAKAAQGPQSGLAALAGSIVKTPGGATEAKAPHAVHQARPSPAPIQAVITIPPNIENESETSKSGGLRCQDPAGIREALAGLSGPSAWSPDPAMVLLSDNGNLYNPGREEFRTLRSRLNLVRERQQLQKLLITSPLPEEGKTFVAANLVQAILWQGKCDVLLVDGDLRASGLHAFLGAPGAPGLSEYLSGQVDEFGSIKRGPQKNFFFVPAGKPAPNASELIGNGRLKLLLDRLAPAFDWIIIDSPPAIPIADAKLISELCDGVLMVVRAGTTPYELAQRAYKEFREKHFVGVVLNGADSRSTYGYHHYYGKHRASYS